MLAKGVLPALVFQVHQEFMIAHKNDIPHSSPPLPNSRRIYVEGQLHSNLRVPFREISLSPTKTPSGRVEINDPVRVYDCSGPWGDPDVGCDVEQGLAP